MVLEETNLVLFLLILKNILFFFCTREQIESIDENDIWTMKFFNIDEIQLLSITLSANP